MPRLPDRVDTPRLVLRHWTEADMPGLVSAITASLDHLRPWMPWVESEPETVEQKMTRLARWRSEWEAGGDSVYGVFLGGVAIGGSGLHRRVGDDGLEIGYWIHADHVGNGYGTELTAALTDAAFTVSGIERVEVHHDKANIPSGRIPEKLGYTLAREVPRDPEAPGEIGIEMVWVMTRKRWQTAHG